MFLIAMANEASLDGAVAFVYLNAELRNIGVLRRILFTFYIVSV